MQSLALGRGSLVTKQEVPLADTHLLGIITLGGLPGPMCLLLAHALPATIVSGRHRSHL